MFIVRGHWGRRATQAHLGREDPGDALDSLDLLDHLELGIQDLKDLKALKEFQDNKEILEIQVRLKFSVKQQVLHSCSFCLGHQCLLYIHGSTQACHKYFSVVFGALPLKNNSIVINSFFYPICIFYLHLCSGKDLLVVIVHLFSTYVHIILWTAFLALLSLSASPLITRNRPENIAGVEHKQSV